MVMFDVKQLNGQLIMSNLKTDLSVMTCNIHVGFRPVGEGRNASLYTITPTGTWLYLVLILKLVTETIYNLSY